MRAGRNYRVDAAVPAGFVVGAHVVARNINPTGATRLPRYVRGKRGVIDRDHGVFVFPDANAAGHGTEAAASVQRAILRSRAVGQQTGAKDSVCLDLWEDYLEPA